MNYGYILLKIVLNLHSKPIQNVKSALSKGAFLHSTLFKLFIAIIILNLFI